MRRDGVLALSSGGAATSAALLFGLFETMEWKMPTPLAVVLAFVFIAAIVMFVGIIVWEVQRLARPALAQFGWRAPVFVKRPPAPDPNQWLVDLASYQVNHLTEYLIYTHQEILDRRFEPEQERPYIVFLVHGFNATVHTILRGQPKGKVQYNGAPLRDAIEQNPTDWWSRVAPNSPFDVQFTQYVEREVAGKIETALSGQNLVKGMFTINAHVEVKVDGDDTPACRWPLGAGGTTFPITTPR
jgi:hypothetical protein